MRKNLAGLVVITLLLLGAVYGQAKFGLFRKPCSQPITYSLGTFDNRFGVTQQDFLDSIDTAIDIWEKPSGLDLFRFDPNGKLKINLVYDYRQEATDKLQDLGISIDSTQASYENLKSRYNFAAADYSRLKQSLDAEINDYNKKKNAYEQEVKYWNSQGGAPKNVVNQLNAERDALNDQAEKINRDQATLNDLANEINAMVDVLNRMASNLNLSVNDYNKIGASRGEEFEEGVYVSSGIREEINIYEFNNESTLIRLLAHEFGHALGLEHLDSNTDAIMYRLNKSSNSTATVEDLAAMKKLCGI